MEDDVDVGEEHEVTGLVLVRQVHRGPLLGVDVQRAWGRIDTLQDIYTQRLKSALLKHYPVPHCIHPVCITDDPTPLLMYPAGQNKFAILRKFAMHHNGAVCTFFLQKVHKIHVIPIFCDENRNRINIYFHKIVLSG